MQNRYVYFSLLFVILILAGCKSESNLNYSADKVLVSKISGAAKFDDLFKLDKEIQLEAGEGHFIASLINILVAKNGDIIAKDSGPVSKVFVFDQNGRFKKILGGTGDGPGEYKAVQAMALNSNGEILLFDFFGTKISLFDSSYNFIKMFQPKSGFRGMYVYGSDKIYLYETNVPQFVKTKNKNTIVKINYAGDTLKSFAPLAEALRPLKFSPSTDGIAFDKQGHIYEMNPMYYEIRKFDLDGNLIKKFGDIKLKMVEQNGGNGQKFEVPKLNDGPFVFDSKIIMVDASGSLDFYDDEGNLVKKGIEFKESIRAVIGNYLYIIKQAEGNNNPKILRYIFK